jgi:hypothetical protein
MKREILMRDELVAIQAPSGCSMIAKTARFDRDDLVSDCN